MLNICLVLELHALIMLLFFRYLSTQGLIYSIASPSICMPAASTLLFFIVKVDQLNLQYISIFIKKLLSFFIFFINFFSKVIFIIAAYCQCCAYYYNKLTIFESSLIYTTYFYNSSAILNTSTTVLKLNINSVSLLDAILRIQFYIVLYKFYKQL